jgi:outer membrane protein assembly factor BamB
VAGPDPETQLSPWIKYRVGTTLGSHGPSLGEDGQGYFGSWDPGWITRFSEATGAVTGNFNPITLVQSTPAIGSDGRVYFLTQGGGTTTGRLIALDPILMDFDWVFNTNSGRIGENDGASPTIGPDGDIVVPSSNGTVWRINNETGTPVWTRPGLSYAIHTIVFTRDDTKVIVSNGSRITALDYATGDVVWNFNCGSESGSPGVAPDGTIIFGCDGGTIFALHPARGIIQWTWQALAGVHHAPAFSETGKVYIGSSDKRMYAFDVATGNRDWSFIAANDIWQAAVVGTDGRIYFCDRFSTLYCITPQGHLVWDAALPSNNHRGPITMGADGTIYVAGNGVYAITQAISEQFADSFFAVRGNYLGGSLGDLMFSDNSYLRFGPGITFGSAQAPVEIVFESTCPRSQLARLKIDIETGATTNNLTQKMYLRDYQAGQWVEIDSRASTVADAEISLDLTTNLNRFVQAGSNEVQLRVTWIQSGPVFVYPWNVRVDRLQFGHLPRFVYP